MGRVVHLYPEEESECGSSGGTLRGGTLACTHFWPHGHTRRACAVCTQRGSYVIFLDKNCT